MQQQNQTALSFPQKVNIGLGTLEIGSSAALTFLRWPGSCGDRFWTGMRSLGVFAPVIFVALGDDPLMANKVAPIALYVPLAGLAIHRLAGLKKPTRRVHSQYDGDPLFLPKGEDMDRYKSRTEPLLLVAVGMVFSPISIGLSRWFFLAGVGRAIAYLQYKMRLAAAVRAMSDSQAEAELVQRLHQEGR
jgi:hypothetical protein